MSLFVGVNCREVRRFFCQDPLQSRAVPGFDVDQVAQRGGHRPRTGGRALAQSFFASTLQQLG